MKTKGISKLSLKTTSILLSNGVILFQLAQPGMAGDAIGNINGGSLPSNAGSFRDPGFVEPLGSQQFFQDNSYFIDNNSAFEVPKDNPLTIKDENLVPNELPSDRPTQDGEGSPQLPKNEQ